jgi:hypothetical protein
MATAEPTTMPAGTAAAGSNRGRLRGGERRCGHCFCAERHAGNPAIMNPAAAIVATIFIMSFSSFLREPSAQISRSAPS